MKYFFIAILFLIFSISNLNYAQSAEKSLSLLKKDVIISGNTLKSTIFNVAGEDYEGSELKEELDDFLLENSSKIGVLEYLQKFIEKAKVDKKNSKEEITIILNYLSASNSYYIAIGIMQFNSDIKDRNQDRKEQLLLIKEGLTKYSEKRSLPLPDDSIEIYYQGEKIGDQGVAGSNTLESINFTKNGEDPLTKEYFYYTLLPDRKSFQVMALLEKEYEEYKGVYSFDGYETLGDELGIIKHKESIEGFYKESDLNGKFFVISDDLEGYDVYVKNGEKYNMSNFIKSRLN